MTTNEIGLFRLADERLAWIDQRQQILAQNIANADTPGYKPQDLQSFAQTLAQTGIDGAATMERADPQHLSGTLNPEAGKLDGMLRPEAVAPDGNAVSLQDELTKVADAITTQAMVINLYHSYLGMFGTVLGKGS
jgi:flagellar basal-body rod protein FlgB